MSHEITLAKKMDILLEWARDKGENASYEAIGKAIGESPTAIQKIHEGSYQNPGARIMDSIARFCGGRLDYWECQTETECWAYLSKMEWERVHQFDSLSPEARLDMERMIGIVQDFMAQADPDDSDEV